MMKLFFYTMLLYVVLPFQDHMSSSVAANIIVKVEDTENDKNDDINELVVPSPPVESSSSHDDHDDKDEDEPATSSLHELSVSPDHQLPREQDDTPAEKPDQSSSDVTSQELVSADDTTDNSNLLTSI